MTTTADYVELAKDQILWDIKTGVIPADISSFSELHDHCDANARYLGKVADDLMDQGMTVLCDGGTAVIEELDKWLSAGRPVEENILARENLIALNMIRNLAETECLRVLRAVDRTADKWEDYLSHINSGAEVFGED